MRSRILQLSFLLIAVFTGTLPAAHEALAGPGELSGYLAVQSFDWREFAEGSRAVRETGPLFGIGLVYPADMGGHVLFTTTGEVFGGPMDYNGHACDLTGENCEASTATVNYFGIKVEGDLSRPIPAGGLSLEPFGGLGFRYWLRNIDSGSTVSGVPTSSFSEDWITVYVRGGIRGKVAFAGKKQLILLAGAKLPFFTQNTAHTSEVGQGPDLNLRPGKQVSFFAEAGMTLDRVTLSIFYDSFRYPQSPTVSNGISIGYQPRSTLDLYGVRADWTF